jgi:hypothetical protein
MAYRGIQRIGRVSSRKPALLEDCVIEFVIEERRM